jgi:hypothetical protein
MRIIEVPFQPLRRDYRRFPSAKSRAAISRLAQANN